VPADGAVVPLLLVAVVDGLLADIVTGVVIGYAAQLMVAMMLGPPQAIANVPATVVYPVRRTRCRRSGPPGFVLPRTGTPRRRR